MAGLGVQVLFGFLLSLPVHHPVRPSSAPASADLYLATLVLAAVATALLLGPVAYHRLVFRQGQKEGLVRAANIMAITGLVTVGLAVSAAVLLVTGYVTSAPDRGADHRVRHLHVRPAVVRVPAGAAALTIWQPEITGRGRASRRAPQFDEPHALEPAADLHTSQRIFVRERHGPEADPEVLDHR